MFGVGGVGFGVGDFVSYEILKKINKMYHIFSVTFNRTSVCRRLRGRDDGRCAKYVVSGSSGSSGKFSSQSEQPPPVSSAPRGHLVGRSQPRAVLSSGHTVAVESKSLLQ